MAYLGVLFFEPQKFWPFLAEIRVVHTLGIIAIIASLLCARHDVLQSLFTSFLFKVLVLFIIVIILGTFLSEYSIFERDADLWRAFTLFILVSVNLKTDKDLIRFTWVLIVFGTLNAVGTIYFYHISHYALRIASYFGDLGPGGSNEFALLMVELLPFPIILLQSSRSMATSGFLAVAITAFVYCLTRTRSRAGFIGLAVIIIVLLLYRIVKIKYVILILTVIVLVFFKTPSSYFERIQSISVENTYEEDWNITSRFDTYQMALQTIIENPLLGVGIGNYQSYMAAKYAEKGNTKVLVVHNAYLQVGSECGIFGVLFYCAMVGYTAWSFKRYSSRECSAAREETMFICRAAFISTLAFSVMAITLPVQFNRMFFILMGVATAVKYIIGKDTSNEKILIKQI